MTAIEAKQKPDTNTTKGKSRSYALLLQQWDQLYIQDSLLFWNYQGTSGNNQWSQLLVPKILQEVVHTLHGGAASGLLGEEKTLTNSGCGYHGTTSGDT